MNTKLNIILLVLALIVVGVVYQAVGRSDTPNSEPLISFGGGSEPYKYQQFTGAIATTTLLKGGTTTASGNFPGTFGGIVITEDSVNAIVFYDATSTAAVTAGVSNVRIADLQAALTEGTYMFDAGFVQGLVMVSTDGFTSAGDFTVLWK